MRGWVVHLLLEEGKSAGLSRTEIGSPLVYSLTVLSRFYFCIPALDEKLSGMAFLFP